jgi:adenosylcobinamide-GDP ribazoletransferase
MAADLAAGLQNRSIAAAAIIPVALMLAGGWQAALSAALASLAAIGVFAFARNRIGGVTGDVFGLTIEISEIVILLTYAAL